MIKKVMRKILTRCGLEISRTGRRGQGHLFGPTTENQNRWLQEMNIGTILDIGAHEGGSAIRFHQIFPAARIYSFEPLPDCFKILSARIETLPDAQAFNVALGDQPGTVMMHRSDFTFSSSLLKMGELHKEAFPGSAGEVEQPIEVDTLDRVANRLDMPDRILMKIDVQGYELKVLAGAKSLLQRVSVVIVETTFRELYEGQPLFADVYDALRTAKFTYAGSWGDLNSPLDGQPLQQDAIFVRE